MIPVLDPKVGETIYDLRSGASGRSIQIPIRKADNPSTEDMEFTN